jgi:hypothetical protein
VLASRNKVLQLDLVLQSKRDALFGQLYNLRIALTSGRPAVNIGGLGPPAIALVVIDDADDLRGSSDSE